MGRYVACTGELVNTYNIFSQNLKGNDLSVKLGIHGRALKWILMNISLGYCALYQ
jgi:hypothetical protein